MYKETHNAYLRQAKSSLTFQNDNDWNMETYLHQEHRYINELIKQGKQLQDYQGTIKGINQSLKLDYLIMGIETPIEIHTPSKISKEYFSSIPPL